MNSHVIWTTPEGYHKVHERMQQISSVETIENAREIEAARSLGQNERQPEVENDAEATGERQESE